MAEASEKSFPFDAEQVSGEYDRVYVADDFAMYFRAFISSGIFMKKSTNLQIIANGDMTVTLKAGSMIIDGYRYENKKDITIPLSPADGVLNRIDRISITWSKGDRDIHYTVQEGEASYNPYAPNCRRTADYKDYVVADVYVGAGAVSIKQENITDTRLNTELCGLAIAFSEIDTTSIFNQFESWFQETKAAGDSEVESLLADYTAWISALEEEQRTECTELVEAMKDLLDGAAAAHLQMEIDSLKRQEEIDYFGLRAKETEFLPDGSIKETIGDDIEKVTEFKEEDASTTITETINVAGALKYRKVTTIQGNIIREETTDELGGRV